MCNASKIIRKLHWPTCLFQFYRNIGDLALYLIKALKFIISPVSQYGSPSSKWKTLFRMGFPQATHTKQDTCQVCFKALMTSCYRKADGFLKTTTINAPIPTHTVGPC